MSESVRGRVSDNGGWKAAKKRSYCPGCCRRLTEMPVFPHTYGTMEWFHGCGLQEQPIVFRNMHRKELPGV